MNGGGVPLLSIIVPVYGVQGYLRECLDSILSQTYTNIELIAIDDCSPDHSGDILDDYADRDPRVTVVHLPHNVGLGLARNAGLEQASGDYVWFVDSDDWIAPGALHAIATKLARVHPDVLLVDHTRVTWLDRHRPSDGHEVLARVDLAQCVSLNEEPELLRLFTVAWNKVLRREFLVQSGITFDVGWYEDLPFTFPVLVAADRIAALSRVCYHYRSRRQEAITHTRSRRHFEVLDQWTRTFDRLDRLGERARPFRAPIFDRMMWHLFVVQANEERMPPGSHRDFFQRTSEHYRRYRPDAETIAATVPGWPGEQPWLDRLRLRLVAHDRFEVFRGLRLLRLGLVWVLTVLRDFKRRAGAAVHWGAHVAHLTIGRVWYRLHRLLPIDKTLALYASYWYRGVSCNPAAIDAEARRLAPGVRPVWIIQKSYVDSVPAGTSYVFAGSMRYYRNLARARWLVNNVNFPDFVAKRRGSIHVQTHHGTPLKVMGLDQSRFPVGAQGTNLTRLMDRCDRWDYSLTSNAHTTEVWARAYPSPYKTLEYGYPRNDRLALAGPAEVAQARRQLGIAANQRVILYAPTFREYQPGYQPLLVLDELADALGPDTLVLARAHYFYKGVSPVIHPGVRDVTAYPCVEDLMIAADVLITDYSSVMFDFAVMDRPIAIYAPDWDAYRLTRGVTFDLLAEPPGVVAQTQAELQEAFASGAVHGELAAKMRTEFRATFCYLDDGHAAERVVRRVFADMLADSNAVPPAP